MNEETFWRCTPGKLMRLAEVHLQVHGGEQKEKPQERLSLQELMSWR
jgi:hypothetical protein